MTEETLQRLLSDLRKAPTETSIKEVTGWFNAVKTDLPPHHITHQLSLTKIIVMTAASSIVLAGAILFITSYNNRASDKSDLKQPLAIELPAKKLSSPIQAPVQKASDQLLVNDKSTTVPVDLDQRIPIPVDLTPREQDIIEPTETNQEAPVVGQDVADVPRVEPVLGGPSIDTSGIWVTETEKLSIDTLFSGVSELVLTGKYPSKINIEGGQRNTVGFNYQYHYQLKGVFAGKNPGSKVTFKKTGATLTIVVDVNKVFTVGVSYGKIMSSVSLAVPRNITVRINSSYGNIIAKQLSGTSIELNTKYGDIEALSLTGNINLQSGYGDIIVEDAVGKMNVSTKYGDIKAQKIKADESLLLSSGYGNVDCWILSREESCRLNLSTKFGKISAKGNEVDIESTKKIQYGKGSTAVTVSSGFGNVKVRFIQL